MSTERHQRYWVIGGVYTDMSFAALKDGARALFGPFSTRGEAHAKWKSVSQEHSSSALTRFTIAGEGAGLSIVDND